MQAVSISRFASILFVLAFLLGHSAQSQPLIKSGTQPKPLLQTGAVIPGDFADPSVIRVGDTYYATGTSSEWAPHYPMYTSKDLLHWTSIGYVFSQTPSWASSSFWAPELFYRHGIFNVYYVARKKADGISCIGVATSKDPTKGFTDHGILLEFGKEAIDPFVIEDSGRLFITFKAYGLDQRPIELLGSRLSDDGLKIEGQPFFLMRDGKREGLEGQCLVKKNGFFYLLTSIGNCCGGNCSYQVEVSRSRRLQGPYTKFAGNPILSETGNWKCTGHGTVVQSKKGKTFYMYHAYSKSDDVYTGRQGMLAEMLWDNVDGWPKMRSISGPSFSSNTFRDEFTSSKLSNQWQWDFRHAQPKVRISNGTLALSGDITEGNITGTALTVRPFRGDYEFETEMISNGNQLQGLVLYGDASQAIGIGTTQDTLEVWQVTKDGRSVLAQAKRTNSGAVKLKIQVKEGYQLRFYFEEAGGHWNELKPGDGNFFNATFLPPWDRSPRPGLLQLGSAPAIFSYFELRY